MVVSKMDNMFLVYRLLNVKVSNKIPQNDDISFAAEPLGQEGL